MNGFNYGLFSHRKSRVVPTMDQTYEAGQNFLRTDLPYFHYVLMFTPQSAPDSPQFLALSPEEANSVRQQLINMENKPSDGHIQLLDCLDDITPIAACGDTRPIPLRTQLFLHLF